VWRQVAAGGFLALTACAATLPAEDAPAVIVNPTADSRAVLQRAVAELLGKDVQLADSALTQSSTLVLEPARVRDTAGRLAQGRETRPSEVFRLVAVSGDCVLVHERSGRRIVLQRVRCAAQP
jgi:hypothetical protein